MRASIQKSTGLLIGSWEPSDDDLILQDAANRGIPAADVELRDVSHDELIAMIATRDDLTLSYQAKRIALYPPAQDYLDAVVKKASADPVVQAEGDAQMNAYINACLAVKLKYPKK